MSSGLLLPAKLYVKQQPDMSSLMSHRYLHSPVQTAPLALTPDCLLFYSVSYLVTDGLPWAPVSITWGGLLDPSWQLSAPPASSHAGLLTDFPHITPVHVP